MVQKRPFDAEEVFEVSFKHPKHVETSNQIVSFSESVLPGDDYHAMPKTSEGGCGQGNSEGNEKFTGEICELPRGAEDFETSFPVSSWATSSTTEDVQSESPIHLELFPEYFSQERPFRTLARYEDIYSVLLESPPRKLVPVGADHQADVPAWNLSGANDRTNMSGAVSDSDLGVGHEAERRLMGTCIIPMPQVESSSFDSEEVGKGRAECSCGDMRSMRCVRQHIVEEREKLIETFGHEKFTELGLADMGEQVVEKWCPEDEQLFHEVVFNNPASLGKNFWNYLSIVFPLRTKKEIVSYYFNVFMLRKRAEQNRNDLFNIDSDDDDLHSSDGNEIATREDDEDSVAESPVYQYQDDSFTDCHENDLQDYDDEYTTNETCAINGSADHTQSNIDDDSKYNPVESPHCNGFLSGNQPTDQTVWQDPCIDKVKDDPCTLSDTGVAAQKTKVKTENGDHWSANYNGLSNCYSQGYVLEPCDVEVCDPGFMSCSKNKIDFLPTCNMIEEVFGDGRRQDMRRDDEVDGSTTSIRWGQPGTSPAMQKQRPLQFFPSP